MTNITILQMLGKLDEFYLKENELKKDITKKVKQLEQLQDDIQLMEMMIAHKSNKQART